MKLQPLTLQDCETVRRWRNDALGTLRTPYVLTQEMQVNFYDNVICNPESEHRYWGIYETLPPIKVNILPDDKTIELPLHEAIIGMGGMTYIMWENSIAEISLIINPEQRKKGYGSKAVHLLLDDAFNRLNLKTVFGECYIIDGNEYFWKKQNPHYSTILPNRKFWAGKYWDSFYFSFDRDKWRQ